MTDPWLVQSVEKNIDHELNESTIELQNGKEDDKTSKSEVEQVEKQNENKQNLQFEDNFAPAPTENYNNKNKNQHQVAVENKSSEHITHQPLADSAAYLEGLEVKLKKLRKGSKLVESLSAKREDCMRTLLDDNTLTHLHHDELNEAINGDSAVHEIYRHLQPVQAVTAGELVHILKHDQLTNNNEEEEEAEEKAATTNVNKN